MINRHKNSHHRNNIEKCKNHAKQAAYIAMTKGDFNPKDARYRSQKGIQWTRNEQFASTLLQIIPVILLIMVLVLKYLV
jgi:hypothetical protein